MLPITPLALPRILLCALLCAPGVQAADCAVASAALAGAQAGYEQDSKAAASWMQREQQASQGLSQCLGSISTSVTVPTFPSISGILDEIKNKVCAAARDKVSSLLPGNLDPWGELSKGRIPTTSIPVNAPSVHQAVSSLPTPQPRLALPADDYPFSL